MKWNSLFTRRAAVAATVLVMATPLLYAQFAVFDAGSYATLGEIWGEDIATGAKLIQEYNELIKIYTSATQTYNLGKQMAASFSGQQKINRLTIAQTSVNNYTQNHYGETAAWPQMVNGRPDLAAAAWSNSTQAVSASPRFNAAGLPGLSPLLARLATVEAIDGSATRCLSTIGQYHSNRTQNQSPLASLFSATFDATAGTNSQIQQLNLLNASNAQAASERMAQGDIHACEVEQQAISNKLQRDQIADQLNYQTNLQRYQSTDSSAIGNTANSFYNYRTQ